RSFGLNLSRLPVNRFDAMADTLARLPGAGFTPTVIVDVGANSGQWAAKISAVYPSVPLHVVEPQAECRPALEALRAGRSGVEIHSVLLSKPGAREVMMAGVGTGSTGAYVVPDPAGRGDLTPMRATTLDVLAGAQQVLPRVEVLVSEVQFYDIEHFGNPVFADYVAAFDRCGFQLYDVASLSARLRDDRLSVGDVVFVRRGSILAADVRWQ